MPAPEGTLDRSVRECLEAIGVSSLRDWDVLVFLYRHQASLASAERIGLLLGHPTLVVAQAVETLEALKLLEQSRASQGVRMYKTISSGAHLPASDCFRRLIVLGESREGRLLIARILRERGVVSISRGKDAPNG